MYKKRAPHLNLSFHSYKVKGFINITLKDNEIEVVNFIK